MQAAGLNVSLNTDDPGVQGSTLSDDFELAYQLLGLSISNLAQFTLNAARASFLPESEKEVLLANLKQKLSSYVS
jgi:adenosine deaminase